LDSDDGEQPGVATDWAAFDDPPARAATSSAAAGPSRSPAAADDSSSLQQKVPANAACSSVPGAAGAAAASSSGSSGQSGGDSNAPAAAAAEPKFEVPCSTSAFDTGEEVPDHDHTQEKRELIIYAIPLTRGKVGREKLLAVTQQRSHQNQQAATVGMCWFCTACALSFQHLSMQQQQQQQPAYAVRTMNHSWLIVTAGSFCPLVVCRTTLYARLDITPVRLLLSQVIFLPVCPWRTDPDAGPGWKKAVAGHVSTCLGCQYWGYDHGNQHFGLLGQTSVADSDVNNAGMHLG
jgi:hypothetical protein